MAGEVFRQYQGCSGRGTGLTWRMAFGKIVWGMASYRIFTKSVCVQSMLCKDQVQDLDLPVKGWHAATVSLILKRSSVGHERSVGASFDYRADFCRYSL